MEKQTKFINAYFWITCKNYLKYGQPLLLRWILFGYKSNNLEELFRTKAKRVVSGVRMWVKCSGFFFSFWVDDLQAGSDTKRPLRPAATSPATSNLSSKQKPLKQALNLFFDHFSNHRPMQPSLSERPPVICQICLRFQNQIPQTLMWAILKYLARITVYVFLFVFLI